MSSHNMTFQRKNQILLSTCLHLQP